MKKISAIILAGDNSTLASPRAMYEISGKTFLEKLITSVSNLDEIIVVGTHFKDPKIVRVKSGKSLLESLQNGLNAAKYDRLLICTSDIPYVTEEDIQRFIEECESMSHPADVYYPVINTNLITDSFPKIKRTTVTLKEGTFTGGNILICKKESLATTFDYIESAYKLRKSPIKLASLIGFSMIFKIILSKFNPNILKIEDIERAASKLLNLNVAAVQTSRPALGIDIDNNEQYQEMIQFELSK